MKGQSNFPILEFDASEAIIEPLSRQPRLNVPVAAVACFFPLLIDELVATYRGGKVANLPSGHVVVPSSAIRDEGASYHYLAPAREVHTAPKVLEILETVAVTKEVSFTVGKTWTTDGFFRTTKSKLDQRVSEGCVTVEMEVASLLAVAERRGINFGQYLFAADNLAGSEWEHRDWTEAVEVQRQIFELAADAALNLASGIIVP